MDRLKDKFREKAVPLAAEIKDIIKNHGDLKLGEITVAQVYHGMKGMIGMVTETSKLDPEEGIRFRGFSIPELREKLPRGSGGENLPEGIFYLLLTGDLPSEDDAREVSNAWARRGQV